MNEGIYGSLARQRVPRPLAQPHHHAPTAEAAPAATSAPPAAAPSATQVLRCATKASSSASTDVALIAIVEAPLHIGETAAAGFARKEAEFRGVLATLNVLESRALQSRLSNPKSGDQLAASFMRLTGDRRGRLINFLADVRRRHALNPQGDLK